MLYVALEPIARRRAPTLLISWNRMLAGNFRDPMIGRDLLAGAALGVLSQVMGSLHYLYAGWRGWPPPVPDASALAILEGGRTVFAQPSSALVSSIFNGLALMLMLVILQMLFRNRWIGAVAFMAIFIARVALGGGTVFDDVIQTIDIALVAILILRFGLLAMTIYIFIQQMMSAPITPDTSAWYAWMGFLGMTIIAAMVVYGMRTALAGQPMFGRAFADADD
jgi:serine/threonine-protein kinase